MRLLRRAALVLILSLGGSAAAHAREAFTSRPLNLRAGPGVEYPVIAVVQERQPVHVFGCLEGYVWCDVGWGPERGWMAGEFLEMIHEGRPVYVLEAAPLVAVPIVLFSFGHYWDHHYVHRPWYRDRGRFEHRHPTHRPVIVHPAPRHDGRPDRSPDIQRGAPARSPEVHRSPPARPPGEVVTAPAPQGQPGNRPNRQGGGRGQGESGEGYSGPGSPGDGRDRPIRQGLGRSRGGE